MCLFATVQVFTYMLNPLTVDEAAAAAAAAAEGGASPPQQQLLQSVPAAAANRSVSGWELRLVMEYCDQVCAWQHNTKPSA
jgi:hypothetical protein